MTDFLSSKAHRMLSTLSIAEHDAFRKFLASPLHNADERLLVAFDVWAAHVRKHAGSDTLPPLDAKSLFTTVYPELPVYQEYRVTRIKSGLVEQFQEYLAHTTTAAPNFFAQLDIADEYRNRGLNQECHRVLEALEAREDQQLDAHSAYQSFWLAEYRFDHASFADRLRMMPTLINAFNNLEDFVLIQRLRLLCAIENQQHITGRVDDDQTLQWAAQQYPQLEGMDPERNPLMRLFYLNLQLLLHPDDLHFDAFYKAIKTPPMAYGHDVMRDFFQHALNYQIRAYNKDQGDLARSAALLGIYLDMCDQGLILVNGRITAFNYKNIVSLFVRLRRWEGLAEFRAQFDGLLAKHDFPACAIAYANALSAFYKQKFKGTNQAADFDDAGALFWLYEVLNLAESSVFWELEARVFVLLIRFETGEFENEDANWNSLRVYLGRQVRKHNISEVHALSYKNFMQAIMALYRALHAASHQVRVKLEALRQELADTQQVAQKAWLLEKIRDHLNSLR